MVCLLWAIKLLLYRKAKSNMGSKKAIVYKSTGSWYKVKSEDNKIYECRIRGKIRLKGMKTTNPVAVGDIVDIQEEAEEGIAVITNIEARSNYIIRKASNLSKQYHIIAANVDKALIIISLTSPKTPIAFIDRFLVTCEAYRIPAQLIFNKVDIYQEEELMEMHYLKKVYQDIGYPCMEVSAKSGKNLDKVAEILIGSRSLLTGNSGVGKSTIVNKIDPDLDLRTAEISDYHKKGKHTTTFAEMFDLSTGGQIIDTPGIKGFGIIDIEKEELFHFFPEFFRESENCQFHNCTHVHEPKCAVKAAVEKEEISSLRYENYLSLFFDDDTKHRQ